MMAVRAMQRQVLYNYFTRWEKDVVRQNLKYEKLAATQQARGGRTVAIVEPPGGGGGGGGGGGARSSVSFMGTVGMSWDERPGSPPTSPRQPLTRQLSRTSSIRASATNASLFGGEQDDAPALARSSL